MLTKDLNYYLPNELIAQSPPDRREDSRLVLFDRAIDKISHHSFHEFPDLLPPKLSIFRNNVSVLKARLKGKRPSGGSVECLLLQPDGKEETTWRCLLKPGRKTAKAKFFGLPNEYSAEVINSLESGEYLVKFSMLKDANPYALAERIGTLPLPPYVKRPVNSNDEKRYQTVYANKANQTAVAAPTAGLHFTDKIIEKLIFNGHSINDLVLSVGLGTFRPIETDKVEDHPMHAEKYFIPHSTICNLNKSNGKRLAIGTTCVRAIEHYQSLGIKPINDDFSMETSLFIKPPYVFKGVDYLLTNFHLPGSSLLCLVAAFISPGEQSGLKILKKIYAEAISRKYRFFSYGDAMLIL